MPNWAALKAKLNVTVHQTFAVEATYTAPGGPSVPITARYHSKIDPSGIGEVDFAQVLEGINRIVFLRAELAAAGIVPGHNGMVHFVPYGTTYSLDTEDPRTNANSVAWLVVPQ